MSTFLLLILRLLHGAGVPVEVCEDRSVRIGGHCATPPPPPPRLALTSEESTISNGF